MRRGRHEETISLIEEATNGRIIPEEQLQELLVRVEILFNSEKSYVSFEEQAKETGQPPLITRTQHINSVALDVVPYLTIEVYSKLVLLAKERGYLSEEFNLDLPELYKKLKKYKELGIK